MKRRILIASLIMFLVMWVLVRVYPAAAACMFAGPETLTKGQAQLLDNAKQRIETRFGSLQSDPVVFFFEQQDTFWPLRLNTYGSTSFLGYKTCVAIGPDGTNIDVTAHELMHAEIESRVSYRRRFTELPIWFDEGLAMQVDDRTRYDLDLHSDSAFVQKHESAGAFFSVDGDALILHYAAAKSEVKKWRSIVGDQGVYVSLKRIRDGETFETVWHPGN